ncbi:MAG: WecB/TagA/CpsF family glycosyltransferase [Pirellulales bacterium]
MSSLLTAESTLPSVHPPEPRRATLMGCQFDVIDEAQALEHCLAWCAAEPRASRMLVTMNVSILMMMRRDRRLQTACRDSDLLVADGVPLLWAASWLGTPLAGRVCGCDLMARLLEVGRPDGLRVFFLGAREEVVTALVEKVERQCPNVIVAGYRNGYFSADEHAEVVQQVRDARADVLFVGMPTPFKETWCHEHREALCTPVILGVGGSFDVLAGYIRRAPDWMQSRGLEWLWRLIQEPRKMWRRYLVTNTQFLLLLAAATVARFNRGRIQDAAIDVATEDRLSPAARLSPRTPLAAEPSPPGVPTPLCIVVPCFNEAESIPQLAERLAVAARELAEEKYACQFVLVDDGSTDDTWQLLQATFGGDPRFRLIRHDRNRGIAAAIMTGIRAADAEIVCSMDADCTYDPAQLLDMLPLLDDGVDMVTASPYHPRGEVRNVPAWRLFYSKSASRLYQGVLRHKLHTYTSCFRVYRRSAVCDLELANAGAVGIVELLWQLEVRGGRVVECPAVLESRVFGYSKMRVASAVAGHLRLMGRASWSRVRGRNSARAATTLIPQ